MHTHVATVSRDGSSLFRDLGRGERAPAPDLELTARELAILELLSNGMSSRGIARRLSISPRTVDKHLEHIFRKIHVNDRLNAVLVAQDLGLLSAP
jgi:DNA-binding NarL/FixJ family response regulator